MFDAVRDVEVVVHLAQCCDEQGHLFVIVVSAKVHNIGDDAVALLGFGILGVEGNHLGQIHGIGRAVDDVCAVVGKHGSRFVGHRVDDA